MDWGIFWLILFVGVKLVVLQGISSWKGGYLTQRQMRARGVLNGWSYMEHGGMWADVFPISPMVAYAVSKYHLHYFSMWGIIILCIAIVVSIAMGYMYQKNGVTTPEAHTHDGRTTFAGWIHGVFAVAALWVCAMVYLGMTTPSVSKEDIIVFSILLTPFFYLGVLKFSDRWTFDPSTKWQVAVEIAGLWVITGIRLTYT